MPEDRVQFVHRGLPGEKYRCQMYLRVGKPSDLKIPFRMTDAITSEGREREENIHLGIGHDTHVKGLLVSARETVFTRSLFRLEVGTETTGVCTPFFTTLQTVALLLLTRLSDW